VRYIRLFAAAICTSVLLLSGSASAATPAKNKGLLISPLKTYTSLDAGSEKTANFTVANHTEKPITVNLSVKQFSVSDYAYNFTFTEPGNNWVSLVTKSVELAPNENKKIDYGVRVPAGSAPGGYYYTLFASATLNQNGLASTVQAASLLYLTVSGKLIESSTPVGSHISHFAYKHKIPYTIDVKNTGNVHYFAYFSGNLNSVFTKQGPTGTSHLLLPGTTRQVSESIPAPLLPGFYDAHFGYKTDAGEVFMQSSYVVYIPPWFIAALLLGAFGLYKLWQRKKAA
jgi:hypothetical protein